MRIVRNVLICLALCVASAPGAEDAIERDTHIALEVETAPPARDPVGAWAAVKTSLPAGHTVRRIAFAMHGVFVLHAPSGRRARTLVTFVGWMDGRYSAHDTERYEGVPCAAAGVDTGQVTSALDKLLAGKQWRQYRRSLDSLILECSADAVFWWLLPVPEGGFQEGVTFATVKVPFEP